MDDMLKGMSAFHLEEWLTFYKMENEPPRERVQTPDEQFSIMKAFAEKHNATVSAGG